MTPVALLVTVLAIAVLFVGYPVLATTAMRFVRRQSHRRRRPVPELTIAGDRV
jgi:hypothetical protein